MTPLQPTLALPLRASTGDDLWGRWQRRAFTFPVMLLLWVLANALLVPASGLAVVVDIVRPRRWVLTRTVVFFWFFTWMEVGGLGVAALLWLGTGRFVGLGWARFVRGNQLLQVAWNRALLGVGMWLYGMDVVVEGEDALREGGPLLVLSRHASTVDTVLPVWLLSRVGRRAFRFVLKRELLGDPCLDVVGNRLPNHFVRRGAQDNSEEVSGARALMRGLDPDSCAVVFPEGGRFSPARRQRLLERLAASGRAGALELAADLKHTLPPLTEGTLAMAEANSGADLVVVGHAGLDGTTGFPDFIAGGLVGVTLRVKIWRLPYASLPRTREGLCTLLGDQWRAVDAFVASHPPRS